MHKIWFTSDLHLGHENIIKYCERPWLDVRTMNDALISNWNSRVAQGDTVYCLGDFFLTRTVDEARVLRRRLNGTIRLIRGNHEQIADQMRNDFEFVKDYVETSFDVSPGRKQRFVLFHYPILSWRGMRNGTIHLHGHAHGATPVVPGTLRRDIGVDSNLFTPVSLEDVVAWADKEKEKFNKSDEYPGVNPIPVPEGWSAPEGFECFGFRGDIPLFRHKLGKTDKE